VKTLVVVSGGDAPGINTALYHFVMAAEASGDKVIGAVGGFRAVLEGRFTQLDGRTLVPWVGMGGSLLASSRDPVLHDDAGRAALEAVVRAEGIDTLLLFGGNGSLRYLPPILSELGIPHIGIPTTIDNDVPGTERTLGFDSACQFASQTIDGIRATGHALEGRFFSVETLGGHTGMLALAIAAASGADAVLVPEYPLPSLTYLAERLHRAVDRRGHALLVYTEFVPEKEPVLAQLAGESGARLRDVRLGHAQRGGSPVHSDRMLARVWAGMAHTALRDGANGVLVWRDGMAHLHRGALSGDTPLPDRALYQAINGDIS
jgi:6-phosphofructokinase 1